MIGNYGQKMIPSLSALERFPAHQQEDRPPLPRRQLYGGQVLLLELIDRKAILCPIKLA